MTDDSIVSRVARARELIEQCAEEARGELPPSAEANLQEALEFLIRIDEQLDDNGGD